ncbi:MAG: radical SAM protein, partial [Planctomycetota bacterium]
MKYSTKAKKKRKKSLSHSPISIGLYSLGCTKNLVDSEVLLGDLLSTGHFALSHPQEAEIIIINTCGFLEAAKKESLEFIEHAKEYKKNGNCKTLIVMGCLAQRYGKEIQNWAEGVDYIVPLSGYKRISNILKGEAQKIRQPSSLQIQVRSKQEVFPEVARYRLTPRHYAYLRLSEGCNHNCSFCVIPSIRGKHRSKPLEFLLKEAQELVDDGALELNLIADDSTFYGIDLYNQPTLPALLEGLEEISGLEWIRLFYAYPTTVTEEMLQKMSQLEKVVPYLDMPIQHISD